MDVVEEPCLRARQTKVFDCISAYLDVRQSDKVIFCLNRIELVVDGKHLQRCICYWQGSRKASKLQLSL